MRKEQHTEKAYVAVSENSCSVFIGDDCILHAETYRNPYHSKNLYLKIKFLSEESFDDNPFSLIKEHFKCPLQVMLYSNEPLARELTAYGFRVRRRCFERKVSKKQLLAKPSEQTLSFCAFGSKEYSGCCDLLFDYYKKAHAKISEFTASFEDFCNQLPKDAAYRAVDGAIVDCAFLEENEIAYTASLEPKDYSAFACSLVYHLFQKHETICFECDDCDAAALRLNELFQGDNAPTYNTYIFN